MDVFEEKIGGAKVFRKATTNQGTSNKEGSELMNIYQRTKNMELSYIRTVVEKAKEMEKHGRSIVHLQIGEPDFTTPKPIIEAAVEALRSGQTHYGPDEGIEELRQVVADRIKREKDLHFDPLENIIITAGASEAIFDAIVGLSGPGQGVIILEPAFGNYYNCCLCAGSKPLYSPLALEDNCRPDFNRLEKTINESPEVPTFLVLNNPHNPTGALFGPGDIKQLADFAQQYNLVVIADEIYEDIYYGNEKPLSIASVPGMEERTILVGGFSKTYAMTGWRLGYAAAPAPLYEPIQKIHQYAVTCAATFSQLGAAGGLKNSEDEVRRMVAELDRRRRYLMDRLDQMEGVTYIDPEGAFYFFINIAASGLNCLDFSRRFLEEQGVAVIPGSTFGPSGKGFIRISYANSLVELEKGMDRLAAFWQNL